ncbi:PREDICTED: 1-acyl-sn-glycerol-3-phosphate acyltransferase alpha-like, partial [Sturnus vulgaris]|uniref:1-acyl-sn-glycerol-3-phosphate acyltransferase alpha-like n=1 Tax=Sturnus vulgaris TaxID=9172 RepID=UPI00071A5C8F
MGLSPPFPPRIIRGLMQHVKRLYGIRMEVRGTHNFPPRQPYVVVSNHQSSLDLLGMMEVLPDRCVPIAKRELLYMGGYGAVMGGCLYGAAPDPHAPPGQCVIQVLPPLPTLGLGPADVPALTERVRAAMLDAFEGLSAELQSGHQSDHRETRSDPRSDHQSDHRNGRSGHQSDPRSDPQDPRSDHRDPQSVWDLWSDPQRPAVTKSDPLSPTATQSD